MNRIEIFLTVYMVESEFSYVHSLQSKKKSTFGIVWADLRAKVKNIQPTIFVISSVTNHPSIPLKMIQELKVLSHL